MTNKKKAVYTLVVQVGRAKNDGLPKGSTGAGLLCYASGIDEPEAVRAVSYTHLTLPTSG